MRQEGGEVSFLNSFGAAQRFSRVMIMLLINYHSKSPVVLTVCQHCPPAQDWPRTRRAGGSQARASPYLHVPSWFCPCT